MLNGFNFICKETYSVNGSFCIYESDLIMIILNVLSLCVVGAVIYKNVFTTIIF